MLLLGLGLHKGILYSVGILFFLGCHNGSLYDTRKSLFGNRNFSLEKRFLFFFVNGRKSIPSHYRFLRIWIIKNSIFLVF